MKTHRILLRLLCATILAFSIPSRAENWISLQLHLDPGRAGHSFSLLVTSGSGATLQHGGLVEVPSHGASHTRLHAWIDAEEPFALLDDTAGDRLELAGPWGNFAPLQEAQWFLPPNENGAVTPSYRKYFLIGAERVGHSFLVGGTNGAYVLPTPGGTVAVAGSAPPVYRFQLSSWWWPGGSARLIDLTTGERSPMGELNTAVAEWTPNPVPVPAGQLWLFFGAEQIGQTFTLHSRAAGGPSEHLQSVSLSALDCIVGSWSNGSMDEDFLHLGSSRRAVDDPRGFGVCLCRRRPRHGVLAHARLRRCSLPGDGHR